ncbi:hypothetical protein WR25_07148 [Diploscapter pachys]|uniref:Uncharacterized protein n=1 Tax=Diploscapter pachys TaxID=2018661 RepID=A0A2A2M4B1_9BILA|nr:hypothetical protein WR25_07148 [Diploscapter pachys]
MQTPTSLRLWLFSDPYMRVPQLVVGMRSGAVAVELEKLNANDRVAVRMPGTLADYLRGNYGNLNLQGVPDEREALQLVLGGQASFAVLDEAQLSRLSREGEFADLAVVGDIGPAGQDSGADAPALVAAQVSTVLRIRRVLAEPGLAVRPAAAVRLGHPGLAASSAARPGAWVAGGPGEPGRAPGA